MVAAIDHGEKEAVYVMSIEDGANIAGGGWTGTAMSVGHFRFAVAQIPVACNGIAIIVRP